MLERLLIQFIVGFIIAIPVAYVHSLIISYLDYMMHFGGYLWRVRYWLGYLYTDDRERLFRSLNKAKSANYDDQQEIMMHEYKNIAARNLMFTRWICLVCMSGFTGVFMMGLFSILLWYYGAGTILIVSFLTCSIAFIYKFASTH